MRKFLAAIVALLLLVISVLVVALASGTIDGTSLRMVLNVMTGLGGPTADATTVSSRYRVPPGFSLALYANDVPRARFLHFTSSGDLLVSRPHAGDILLLRRDENADGRPDGREVLIKDLKRPLGLDTHEGWLYIAESHRIGRVAFDSASGSITGAYQPLVEGLTDNGNHWSKSLRIGPDNKLYLSQGSTCNICAEEDPRRATIMRFDLDGGNAQIVATGLRNSVGLDWAPWSGELFATDNGRDLLGDNFPPCELNLIRVGGFYGWPYYNGNNLADPDMGTDPLARERTPTAPAHGFRAHNAPLGIHFPDATALPADYARSALVALHGSWNRSDPDGYKVVSLHWTDSGIVERDFLSGFMGDGDIKGRPVDVAQGPDGAIYISDDYAGAIYRVNYGAAKVDGVTVIAPSRSQLDAQPPTWLTEADLPAMAARGAALYEQHQCSQCHEQGENPKRLDNLADRLGYTAVSNILQAPQSPMPVYPLNATEQRELAVFLLRPDLQTQPMELK